MKKKYHISIDEAAELLKNEKNRFVTVIEDGNMSVEYYAPKDADKQKPHTKDELYIIASGYSEFLRDKKMINCKKGDVIFVPAQMIHRFINFSADFATWVIFYGDEK